MLKDWNKLEVPAGEEVENRLKAAREMLLKTAGYDEGKEAAGYSTL